MFFFSSRRRHTRCSRDWSSDVCSSDLRPVGFGLHQQAGRARAEDNRPASRREKTPALAPRRSEEHTSELQSRLHLVCRLLLEKKKKPSTLSTTSRLLFTVTRRCSLSTC